MSLTNPNTVVTEQRLNDFYKGILPYLGGMPEMLANKFSKGDLYSTDEKMIGQWVDGKPLYQKIVQNIPMPQSENQWVTIYTADSNVNIVKLDCIMEIPNYETVVLPYGQLVTVQFKDNEIKVQTTQNFYRNNTVTAFIRYTKTTDSAISIGNDTDYSTEEKIVGTWIDGKPLYQRSYKFENFSISPSDTQKNFGDISSLSIDYGMVVEALIDDGGYLGTNWVDVFIRKSEGTFGAMSATKTISNKTIYITIQYTKAN